MLKFQKEPTPLQNVAPSLPEQLINSVMKALSRSPDERYQTAEEMSEALATTS